MRTAVAGLLLAAALLTACAPDAGDPDDAPPPTANPYTEKIAACLPDPSTPDGPAAPGEPIEPRPAETLTTDAEAGVAYRAYGDPWGPFALHWTTPELGLTFTVGQSLRAETGTDGTPNWAAIGSTRMPNVVGDAIVTDLACLGALAVADVTAMTGYESGAGSTKILEQGPREVDGRAAWLNVSRYEVADERFASTSELQGLLLVDTDRGVCVLYVTVPDARGDLDGVIGEVFGSVRVG